MSTASSSCLWPTVNAHDVQNNLYLFVPSSLFVCVVRSKQWVIPFQRDRESYIEYVSSFQTGRRVGGRLPDSVIQQIDDRIQAAHPVLATATEAKHASSTKLFETPNTGTDDEADTVGGPPSRNNSVDISAESNNFERRMSAIISPRGSPKVRLFDSFQTSLMEEDRCEIRRVGPRRKKLAHPQMRRKRVEKRVLSS